jgi:hypothetical protein
MTAMTAAVRYDDDVGMGLTATDNDGCDGDRGWK